MSEKKTRTRDSLDRIRAENQSFQQAIEQLSFAILVLDSNSRVQYLTSMADRILSANDGLHIKARKLQAGDAEQDALLQQAITRTIQDGAARIDEVNGLHRLDGASAVPRIISHAEAILITRSKSRKPLPVIVVPFHGQTNTTGYPTALVFLNDPDIPPRPRARILHTLYGLSPLQVKLADLLLAGFSVKEAAKHLRVTESSARFHLKIIYRKTGVASQVGLVRLLLHFPGA